MVRNLKEAISLYHLKNSKLSFFSLLQTESLLLRSPQTDPNFLEFASLYAPLLKPSSKLFQILQDESFLKPLSISKSMKVLDLLTLRLDLLHNSSVLNVLCRKILSKPTDRQTFNLSKLLVTYIKYSISPSPEILSKIAEYFFKQPYREKQIMLLPFYKCITQLRLLEFPEFSFLDTTYNNMHTTYIPELLKLRYKDDLKYYSTLCYWMCMSQNWKYTTIWNSLISAVSMKMDDLPSVKENPIIHNNLLLIYDGLDTFAPELLQNNATLMKGIRSKLNYDPEYVQSLGISQSKFKSTIDILDSRQIPYEHNKVIDQLYNATIFIQPNKILCYRPSKSYILNSSGRKIKLETASKKYLRDVLNAKGYEVYSIKKTTQKAYLDTILK